MSREFEEDLENTQVCRPDDEEKEGTVKKPMSRSKYAADSRAGGFSRRQERELEKKKKRRRWIVMIIAEIFTLACIFGYGYFLRQWNQIQRPEFNEVAIKNNDLDMDTVERMKGYWTIAIFGVDARGKELTNSTNADVNLICNINLDTGEIKLVSVFRDTYLNISKKGAYNKINQAYFLGGPEQAVAALNRNLDLNITDYMTFNWKAVADAINVLGGVDVEISKAEFYYINSFITETVKVTGVGSHQLTSAGMNHLDGVQAVAYGRLRLMDTDYARTERQRKIIKLAFEKAKKADFETLNRVLGTVFPQVATSINVNDIFNSLKIINRYHLGETTGFPQARGDANMGKKGACVIPQTLESNVVKLHEFLFGETDYTPSAAVKNIGAKIAADSGMYKEGRYVESVGTGGGVIQSAKESKAAKASEAQKEDESRYGVIYVLDQDGNKVKKTIELETNADGDYIQPETDANGFAKGWSLDKDGKLIRKKSEDKTEQSTLDLEKPSGVYETDANGNLILKEEKETSGDLPNLRPGYLDESMQNGNNSNNAAPTTGASIPTSGSQNSGITYTPPTAAYPTPTGSANSGITYTPPTAANPGSSITPTSGTKNPDSSITPTSGTKNPDSSITPTSGTKNPGSGLTPPPGSDRADAPSSNPGGLNPGGSSLGNGPSSGMQGNPGSSTGTGVVSGPGM